MGNLSNGPLGLILVRSDGFISDAGLLAIAVIVLLRSAAIPIPVPADLLVVMVGVRAREQQFVLWPAWLVLSGSTTIGAALFYRSCGGSGTATSFTTATTSA